MTRDGVAADVGVSLVIPLFRERAVLDELVSRCLKALDGLDVAGELVLVDDASNDGTAADLHNWQKRDPRVRPVLLVANVGQFRATQAGLRVANGACVVTLDGDLQDPPECVAALVGQLWARADVDVVFAQKLQRDDPLWLRSGAWAYRLVQARLCDGAWPGSVGSFAAMRREVAAAVVESPLQHANLAAVVLASRARATTVPYARQARRDGGSRVGAWGLVREALGSLRATRLGSRSRAARGL